MRRRLAACAPANPEHVIALVRTQRPIVVARATRTFRDDHLWARVHANPQTDGNITSSEPRPRTLLHEASKSFNVAVGGTKPSAAICVAFPSQS
jgi:hypothetical protein